MLLRVPTPSDDLRLPSSCSIIRDDEWREQNSRDYTGAKQLCQLISVLRDSLIRVINALIIDSIQLIVKVVTVVEIVEAGDKVLALLDVETPREEVHQGDELKFSWDVN